MWEPKAVSVLFLEEKYLALPFERGKAAVTLTGSRKFFLPIKE